MSDSASASQSTPVGDIVGIVLGTVGVALILGFSYYYYEFCIRPTYSRSILADDYYNNFQPISQEQAQVQASNNNNKYLSDQIRNPMLNQLDSTDYLNDDNNNKSNAIDINDNVNDNNYNKLARTSSKNNKNNPTNIQISTTRNPLTNSYNLENMLFNDYNDNNNDINDSDVMNSDEEVVQVFLSGIVKSGYLNKKSTGNAYSMIPFQLALTGHNSDPYTYTPLIGLVKDWLRRWFFIKEGKLYYIHHYTDIIKERSDIKAVLVSNLLIGTVKQVSTREFQIISPGQRKGKSYCVVYYKYFIVYVYVYAIIMVMLLMKWHYHRIL